MNLKINCLEFSDVHTSVLFRDLSSESRARVPADIEVIPILIIRYSDLYLSKVGGTNAVKLVIGNLSDDQNRRLSRIVPETFFDQG